MKKYAVLVEVRLRKGIADPQGATVERAVPALGFNEISNVKIGKAIRLDIDAEDEISARHRIDELCERFLTNPVIEDAVVTITDAVAVVA